ncbi:MAG: hypothetical protein IIC20_07755 [Chloroflexi bacterium]|nr:hypothetical protein [Chloroflexota bacterium]
MSEQHDDQPLVPTTAAGTRSWAFSVAVAALVVGLGVALSATVNPLLDRRVHWDWTAALASALFVFLLMSVRRRWM